MTVVFAILLVSFLIFIHELGHFVAAKLSGVQVNEFSMFMGPAIFKKQKGETLYAIRCIPIGGSCAMEGENGDSDNPRAFGKAAWWKRLIILVAGSGMNFIAGILIMLCIYMPATEIVTPVISGFESYSTINGAGGLQTGDRLLEVDGEKIYSIADFDLILSLNTGDVHDLVVERNGEKVTLSDFEMQRHSVVDNNGKERQLLGVSFTKQKADFSLKVQQAWYDCLDTVRNVRLSLQMLLTGRAGLEDMTGVVGIVKVMSDSAAETDKTSDAVINMLYFGAFLAINLAVMNMLPVPALDGGRATGLLITTAAEKITGKKINPKYEAYLHGAGMILLFILMAVLMFKDIFVIIKG